MLSYKQKFFYIKGILIFCIVALCCNLIFMFIVSMLNHKNINDVVLQLVAKSLLGIKVKPALISGITQDNSKYSITSKRIRDYMESFFFHKNIRFDYPIMHIQMNDNTILDIASEDGEFDEENKIFNLYKNVRVKSSNGINLSLDKVYFNLVGNVLYSNEPMTIYSEQVKTVVASFHTLNKLKILNLKGPIKSYEVSNENNRFITPHDVQIDIDAKIITTLKPFTLYFQDTVFVANNLKAYYISLSNVFENLKNKSLSNFKTIDMDNIVFSDKVHNGKLIADKMFYRQAKHLIIIKSQGDTSYKSDKYDLTVKNRLEFNDVDRILVARGKNIFKTYNSVNHKLLYQISAQLIYFQINQLLNEYEYAEAFDKVQVITDTAKINSDYAYLDNKTSTLYMEENVTISYDSTVMKACRVVLDLTTNNTQVIPCDDSRYLQGKIKVKNIEKNAKSKHR